MRIIPFIFFAVFALAACKNNQKVTEARQAQLDAIMIDKATYQIFLQGNKEDKMEVKLFVSWKNAGEEVKLDSLYYAGQSILSFSSSSNSLKAKVKVEGSAANQQLKEAQLYFSSQTHSGLEKTIQLKELPEIVMP